MDARPMNACLMPVACGFNLPRPIRWDKPRSCSGPSQKAVSLQAARIPCRHRHRQYVAERRPGNTNSGSPAPLLNDPVFNGSAFNGAVFNSRATRGQARPEIGLGDLKPLLRVESAEVRFGNSIIVDHASLVVAAGQIVSLIGPNGSGKTTLIRAALGLQRLSAGRVWRAPNLKIGYVPQRVGVDPSLPITVERFLRVGTRADRGAVGRALDELGVRRLSDRPVQQVSGGEMQRILIARALLRDPQLLVLDEPAQGVDVTGQEELYRMIGNLRTTRGCGILIVSHDLHLVMAETDHVICLNGHICCEGQPESVADHPAYLELFGDRRSEALAVYRHHHDHHHGPGGDVVPAADGRDRPTDEDSDSAESESADG